MLYLGEIIGEKPIEIRAAIENQNSADYSKYSDLLTKYIELMLTYRPEETVAELEKAYYLPDMMFPIVRKFNNAQCAAILYRKNKEYQKSLDIYIQLLIDFVNEMLKEENISELQKTKFHKFFYYALSIALINYSETYNHETDMWFTLLDKIYTKLLDLYNNKTGISTKIIEFLTIKAKDILSDLVKYAKPSDIFNRIVEKYSELEIGKFNDIIKYLLTKCEYEYDIAKSAMKVSGQHLQKELEKYITKSTKAYNTSTIICGKCSRKIESASNTKMVLFACGHMFHLDCVDPLKGCINCTNVTQQIIESNEENKEKNIEESKRINVIEISGEGVLQPEISMIASKVPKFDKGTMKKIKKLQIFEKLRVKPYSLLG